MIYTSLVDISMLSISCSAVLSTLWNSLWLLYQFYFPTQRKRGRTSWQPLLRSVKYIKKCLEHFGWRQARGGCRIPPFSFCRHYLISWSWIVWRANLDFFINWLLFNCQNESLNYSLPALFTDLNWFYDAFTRCTTAFIVYPDQYCP